MIDEKFRIKYDIPLPPPVRFVIERLREAGFEAYAVGGAVRDHVMGKSPTDYDVTTSATPEEMLRVFRGERVVETGLKHGTLTIVRDGMNIETTTYRIDGSYADGRHPDSVIFTDSLREDLRRRDFTINAMAYSPSLGEASGELVDLFGGKDDMEHKTVRCVGCAAERFSEDGLRILRALRFSAVLDFTPDTECAEAIFSLTPLLSKISRERIYVEITKLLCGTAAARVLSDYASVVAFALPPLTAEGVRRSAKTIAKLDPTAGADVRYALLFNSLTESEAASAMASLKPSTEERRAVLSLVKARDTAATDEYAVLCLMRDCGDGFPEKYAAMRYASGCDTAEHARWIAEFARRAVEENRIRRISQLGVSGEELMAEGLRGAEIGARLRELLDEKMKSHNSTKDPI